MEAVRAGSGAAAKKRLTGDVWRKNLFTIARDLGRLPSELFGSGKKSFKISIRGSGWIGKWLRFSGTIQESGKPISSQEFQDILTLYEIEEEQRDRDRRMAELG